MCKAVKVPFSFKTAVLGLGIDRKTFPRQWKLQTKQLGEKNVRCLHQNHDNFLYTFLCAIVFPLTLFYSTSDSQRVGERKKVKIRRTK